MLGHSWLGSKFGEALDGYTINWGRTFKSRNGGTPSGAAANKRAATKRRNMRARSRK